MRGSINAYNNAVDKAEEKNPFATPSRKWWDNIKMDLKEMRWEGVGRRIY
jgi:hypothetical protein